jgi:hypothetical protein
VVTTGASVLVGKGAMVTTSVTTRGLFNPHAPSKNKHNKPKLTRAFTKPDLSYQYATYSMAMYRHSD